MRKIGLLLLLALSAPTPGGAATQRPLSLPDLVRGSDVVVVATAVRRQSAWNAERTRIYTRTSFRVAEALKGTPGATVEVETIGGVADGVGFRVAGVPGFAPGERA